MLRLLLFATVSSSPTKDKVIQLRIQDLLNSPALLELTRAREEGDRCLKMKMAMPRLLKGNQRLEKTMGCSLLSSSPFRTKQYSIIRLAKVLDLMVNSKPTILEMVKGNLIWHQTTPRLSASSVSIKSLSMIRRHTRQYAPCRLSPYKTTMRWERKMCTTTDESRLCLTSFTTMTLVMCQPT